MRNAGKLLLMILAAGMPLVSAATQTGKQIYISSCAACHGTDGRGASRSTVGFDLPLPDFSDCDFASREPVADWVIVAHEGGPVRGFSHLMPAFGEHLTVDELELAVRYINSFCDDDSWPRGELNLPRPLVTEKAFPEDEAVLTTIVNTDQDDSIEAEVLYGQRFGTRSMVEIKVPFAWQRNPVVEGVERTRSSSVGDIAVGVKRALWHDAERGFIVSAAAEFIFPTGDDDHGFGKGTLMFEPFLSYGQILPAYFFFHGQAGLEIAKDADKAEDEAFLRLALGRSITAGKFGRTLSPMVEMLGGRELESGADTNWDVVPQVQITLNTRQHIRMSVGVRTPLTNTADRDTTVIAYLLWDWFDGGLFAGW